MQSIQPFRPMGQAGNLAPVSQAQIAQVMRSFLAGFAPNSRITMRYVLLRCAEDLGMLPDSGAIEDVPWHTVTAAGMSELVYMWSGQLQASTVRLYLHGLRGVARACYIHGLMPSDNYLLLREVKLPRGRNRVGRGRAVELRYRQQLIANCMEDERIHGVRDAALIATFFGSGMRRAEVASVLDEHIDLDEAEILVTVKGGDRVKKYLGAWTIPYLQAWRDVRRANGFNSGPFFCGAHKGGRLSGKGLTGRGIFYLFEQRSIKAGLPFLVRPHDGRRTVGTKILTEHGELVAQRVLGHADLNTTRIYDKRSDAFIKDIFKAEST